MSGARGGEPEEARPRVGGAGCASPSRLRFETRGTAARPGRCGRVVGAGGRGRRYPSAWLFWLKVAWAVLRKLPHAEESRQAALSLQGKELRGPNDASQDRGYGFLTGGSSALFPDCAGGAGSHGHACAARARAPWGSGEAPSPARGWGEGAALWTLARARSAVTRC